MALADHATLARNKQVAPPNPNLSPYVRVVRLALTKFDQV